NPTRTVPTLEDNGLVVWDSHSIVQYLMDEYDQTQRENLHPKDFRGRTKVNQMLFLKPLFYFYLWRKLWILYDDAKLVTQEKLNFPTLRGVFSLQRVFGGNNLTVADTHSSKWIAGDPITVADMSLVTTMVSLKIMVKADGAKYPNIRK
ncbi:glutathione S-transferase D5-like, partial [Euwallacea similis]|uniref:glutathione S-transferase D5-like n=1 Tax=Euwallacea similis TaxID=1736056 RepID=UPI00344DCFDC